VDRRHLQYIPRVPNPSHYAFDRAHWKREGWLVVRGLLDERTVAGLNDATDALERQVADIVVDTTVGGTFFEVQSASGRKGESAVVPGLLRKITGPSRSSAPFSRLCTDHRILALVRAAGLASPRCVIDQVNPKAARLGSGFPYHQDAGFLFGAARRRLETNGGAHVVIALDPCDEDNGGFEVLGRTHHTPLVDLKHRYDTSNRNEGLFDTSLREIPRLLPGDAVLFHPYLAHGSGPNRSNRRRRLATMWWVG